MQYALMEVQGQMFLVDANEVQAVESYGPEGIADSPKPDDVERAVGELFRTDEWVMVCHRVIWHGRRCCHARNPACGACPVADICPSYGIGETDPEKAALLIREPRA